MFMAAYSDFADQQLFDRLQNGDRHAYAEIFGRYKGPLYIFAYKRLGSREEVRDIVQDVFLSLWQRHGEISLSAGLGTYLHAAVRNKVLDTLSRRKLSQRYIDSFNSFKALAANDSTDHLLRHRELAAVIDREVQALPAKMRRVFELSRKEGYSRKQIAQELGLSEQTVKSHMQHALKILREKLGPLFFHIFL